MLEQVPLDLPVTHGDKDDLDTFAALTQARSRIAGPAPGRERPAEGSSMLHSRVRQRFGSRLEWKTDRTTISSSVAVKRIE
jgi:hypothetical protein